MKKYIVSYCGFFDVLRFWHLQNYNDKNEVDYMKQRNGSKNDSIAFVYWNVDGGTWMCTLYRKIQHYG